MPNPEVIKVLVVEDNPNDVAIIKRAMRKSDVKCELYFARDGEEALDFLYGQGEFEDAPRPDLILLDVLMPKQSGLRLYSQLKTNKSLEKIPVVILSAIAKRTFLRSQKALVEFGGAEVPEPEIYLEKPVEFNELAKVIKDILG